MLMAAGSASGAGSRGPAGDSLPRGISAWTYSWSPVVVDLIRKHDAAAPPDRRFRYLFPYCGSVEVDAKTKTVSVWYSTEVSCAFSRSLPGTRMLAIVDGRQDKGEFDDWSATQYETAARLVAEKVLADPCAAGVQIDIEPFRAGHVPFYRHLRRLLNARAQIVTAFVGPGHPEPVIRGMFESCDILVIAGYDFGEETPAAFRDSLDGALKKCARIGAEAEGRFMVGVPAAASSLEYEYEDGEDCTRKTSGFKQTDWLGGALEAVARHEQDPGYVGVALWVLTEPPRTLPVPKGKKCGAFPWWITDEAWGLLRGTAPGGGPAGPPGAAGAPPR